MLKRPLLKDLENFEEPEFGKGLNLIGQTFNRLKVVKYAGKNKQGNNCWYCECSCGNEYAVGPISTGSLRFKNSQSCGCLSKELTSKRSRKYNKIEFITKDIIKVYVQDRYFICDYDDWEKYNCGEVCWNFKYDKESKKLNSYYPFSNTNNGKNTYFCRLIMEAKKGEYIDHKNGCTFDCRRKNLRRCKNKENSRNDRLNKNNKSGYHGVGWHKASNKWRARITVDQKEIYLGTLINLKML